MGPIKIESWIHGMIRKKLREDAGFRQWMGRETLPEVTREDIDQYHIYLFRKALAYASQKSVFYRELVKKTGVKAEDIRTLKDIAKIPCTTPEDIAQNPYHFACMSLGDITSITTFASSGTTGPQKKVFVSDADLERMTDFMGAGMTTVAKEGDIVQIMLPSRRPLDQADLLGKGVSKMGGVPVISGNALSPEEQVRKAAENHPSVLFAETAYMWRVTKETYLRHDLKSIGVKTVFLTAEHLADSMRKQLKDIWGCDVCVHYGMTEMGLAVSIECGAHDGYHYNEADLMAEVIDPQTGEALGDDEEGEVVFTAFNREAMPLLRYRTHDISRLIGKTCRCGASTLQKIAPVTRRREAIAKIGDDELFPTMFDELLYTIPEIIDYQITLSTAENATILAPKIEVTGTDENTVKTVEEKLSNHPVIKKNLKTGTLKLSPAEPVSQGSLTRMSRAKKLIVDRR